MFKRPTRQSSRKPGIWNRICQNVPPHKRWQDQHHHGLSASLAQISKHALLTHSLSTVFPELRTQLRTYHPVPPLQKTDGNLQDAPRIKNILKDCFLPSEGKGVPSPSPTEILTRLVCPHQQIRPTSAQTCRSLAAHPSLQNQNQSPPTTVVNLLFAITSPSYSPVGLSACDSSDRSH